MTNIVKKNYKAACKFVFPSIGLIKEANFGIVE